MGALADRIAGIVATTHVVTVGSVHGGGGELVALGVPREDLERLRDDIAALERANADLVGVNATLQQRTDQLCERNNALHRRIAQLSRYEAERLGMDDYERHSEAAPSEEDRDA